MTPPRTLAALAIIGLLALTGCAQDPATDVTNAAEVEPSTPAPSTTADTPPPSATPTIDAEGLVIVVSIAKGQVRPLGEAHEAKVGETITVDVTSDTEDELHLHAEPEETFEVEAGTQSFTFEVDVPGSVSLESHEVGGTIATIDVRP
ncbi:hypothetical protein [Mumia quercus]|uniref:hypothetical protein n=1 Tax=Mumia quercus TaxID=2976125 RepID=UPI0021D3068B|nr:hypothetical protein [Mumia quercus]